MAGMPEAVACKIEMPDDNSPGSTVGTRIVEQAYTFSSNDQIGEGTYGKVFVGTDRQGNRVALKMIRMDNEKEGFPITAIREIKILSCLKNEHVVNLREIVRSKVNKESHYRGHIYMVFDYAEHDLTGLQEKVKRFSVPQVKCIMRQLLKGLAFIHNSGVLHRDLKASNLLIDKHGILKLADFGLARNFQGNQEGKLTNRVITLWYRPPELMLGADKYGAEVDMWSVGCIFAELLAGKPIFPGDSEMDQLSKIFSLMGAPTEATWPGVSSLEFYDAAMKGKSYPRDGRRFEAWCRGEGAGAPRGGDRRHSAAGGPAGGIDENAVPLLRKMLALDPRKRISAIEALRDEWFFSNPAPIHPSDMPRHDDTHEWNVKKMKRHVDEEVARRRAAAAAAGPPPGAHPHHHPGAQQQQQQQHHGHHGGGGGYGGHPGAPGQLGVHDGRNVRPRTGGGGGGYGVPGGPPAAAPPGYGGGGGAPPAAAAAAAGQRGGGGGYAHAQRAAPGQPGGAARGGAPPYGAVPPQPGYGLQAPPAQYGAPQHAAPLGYGGGGGGSMPPPGVGYGHPAAPHHAQPGHGYGGQQQQHQQQQHQQQQQGQQQGQQQQRGSRPPYARPPGYQ